MKTDDVNRLIDQRKALAQPVDAVNMTQEHVDETAKGEHEPLYMDMSQVPTGMPDWKPGMVFPAPKKEWVGLTDEEIIECFDSVALGQVENDLIINKHVNIFTAIRSIEAKLKEKNSG